MEQIEQFIQRFSFAAGQGALVELRLRMLVETIPSLEHFAHEHKLEDVEGAICEWFGDRIDDTERETLQLCRRLRNKLLHCDFYVARKKLHEMGAPAIRGGVTSFNLAGLSPAEQLERFETGEGASFVADGKTSEGIFGWLLELGAAGDFEQAAEIFRRADRLVLTLADRRWEIEKARGSAEGA